MRPVLLIAVATATCWPLADAATAASCSYFASYPPAVGRHSFMLATATPVVVPARPDSTIAFARRLVPAQVMRVVDVAGYEATSVREGLKASGGRAVFVRHRISMSCTPFPALDGALDSAGVSGLYVGRPRPAAEWVDGQPTFDVFRTEHYPLPQRLNGPSGHLVASRVDSTPTMTSDELFTMYRELWAESVAVGDRSPEARIRSWLARYPTVARKQPAEQVAFDMLLEETRARLAAHRIPLGGTFAIHVVVPGIDSLVMFGQTASSARQWILDVAKDSLSGVPVAIQAKSFAIDVTTAAAASGFVRPSVRINPCPSIAIVVPELPIVVGADSSWSGEMGPSGFFECAPAGSPLAALTDRGAPSSIAYGPTTVRVQLNPDGRVTLDARTSAPGKTSILVRGERISREEYPRPVWPRTIER